jgi:hypothetical protein
MAPLAKVIPLYGPKSSGGLELTVTLRGIKPAIWRRLRLAGSLTLRELHHVLQIAFGWDDTHTHEFHIGDARYGMGFPGMSDLEAIPDEREFKLGPLLRGVASFEYVYDLGDDWIHELAVKQVPLTARAAKAECLDGDRAAPLEDCGGPLGYMDLLKAIARPGSKRGRELLEWAGDFDPAELDLAAINRDLRTAGTKAFLRKRERLYEGL